MSMFYASATSFLAESEFMMTRLGWGVAMAAMVVGGCVGIGPAVAPAADRVQVIAHRVASADAPENTLASFSNSVR